MKWDKLFEEFMPKKTGPGRETHTVTRPKSLDAKNHSQVVTGMLPGIKETHELVLEFDAADRASVVKMLRRAADEIEAGK